MGLFKPAFLVANWLLENLLQMLRYYCKHPVMHFQDVFVTILTNHALSYQIIYRASAVSTITKVRQV